MNVKLTETVRNGGSIGRVGSVLGRRTTMVDICIQEKLIRLGKDQIRGMSVLK